MQLNSLTAISPIDGRYRNQVSFLDEYFSEFALMKYRVLVEIGIFSFSPTMDFLICLKTAKTICNNSQTLLACNKQNT